MPTTLEQLQYGFDRDSRRTWRQRAITQGWDNAYAYDSLSQVISDDRGDLNLAHNAIAGIPANGNRLMEVSDAAARRTDRAGRMLQAVLGIGEDWNKNYAITRDAWSRIVGVAGVDGETITTPLASYGYDGLTPRITRYIDNEDVTLRSDYNEKWRPVEECKDSESTAAASYLWGSRQTNNQIVRLSRKHPRYGYRRITTLLRREGRCVNAKWVARLRRAEGLQVRKRQRRMRRLGPSQAQRLSATRCNQVWSWDFVADQTESSGAFRILTLIDEHTRHCLATHAAWSIRAPDVLAVLEQVMRKHGTPEHIRSDNGPEFVACAIQDWLAARQIKTLYIKPGSPWENAYVESFHGELRDESLNREVFGTLAEARVIIDAWRQDYNNKCRAHSSLGYRTPAEAAACCQTPLRPHLATLDESSAVFDSSSTPNIKPKEAGATVISVPLLGAGHKQFFLPMIVSRNRIIRSLDEESKYG